jgi:hypothetical protein
VVGGGERNVESKEKGDIVMEDGAAGATAPAHVLARRRRRAAACAWTKLDTRNKLVTDPAFAGVIETNAKAQEMFTSHTRVRCVPCNQWLSVQSVAL